tara:strand:+ start:735 stop:1055 length:321 start_codon:yes stop_codon:yes gene_type:complete
MLHRPVNVSLAQVDGTKIPLPSPCAEHVCPANVKAVFNKSAVKIVLLVNLIKRLNLQLVKIVTPVFIKRKLDKFYVFLAWLVDLKKVVACNPVLLVAKGNIVVIRI